MKIRDVEKLFQMPRRNRSVDDFYAARLDDTKLDKRYIADLKYYFGFLAKPGDVLCAILIRPYAKRKKEIVYGKRKAKS